MLALSVVVAGAVALSRSCLTLGEDGHPSHPGAPAVSNVAGMRSGRELVVAGRAVSPSPAQAVAEGGVAPAGALAAYRHGQGAA